MITKVIMPKLGLTMTKGQVVKWLKKEGDRIEKGEQLVEIETDKVVFVIEAQGSGILRKTMAKGGDVLAVGRLLAIIADNDEEIYYVIQEEMRTREAEILSRQVPVVAAKEVTFGIPQKIKATPRAKKLAKEKRIELTLVNGTGNQGQILEKDVKALLEGKMERKRIKESQPYLGVRKTIGQRMSESLHQSPQFTITTDVNMEELMAVHLEIAPEFARNHGIHVTYTEMIAKLVSEVLKKHPILNSSLVEDQILIYENINLGVAVASEHGLIVPVIMDADKKSLLEIAQDVKTLVEKVRSKTLSLEDVIGGTFTLSNLGMTEIDIITPIINPPESAILGIGTIKERPVVMDGKIVIKPLVQLSLTVDHRIMDGMDAAKFIQALKQAFEDPYQALGLWKFGQAKAVSEGGLVVRWQARRFKSVIDEPLELGGTDKGPNPIEVFMGAFASCFVLMFKVAAKARGFQIDRVEASAQPDSFEKISRISFDLTCYTKESMETLGKLLDISRKLCPIHTMIRSDIQIDFNIKIKSEKEI